MMPREILHLLAGKTQHLEVQLQVKVDIYIFLFIFLYLYLFESMCIYIYMCKLNGVHSAASYPPRAQEVRHVQSVRSTVLLADIGGSGEVDRVPVMGVSIVIWVPKMVGLWIMYG